MNTLETYEIQRLREGDRSAIASIYDRYANRVKYYILRQPAGASDERAEDILHAALLNFFHRARWNLFDPEKYSSIGQVLSASAARLLASEARRDKAIEKLKKKLADEGPSKPLQPDEVVLRKELSEQVDTAVDGLPPRYQEPATLRFVHGCSVAETALLTRTSEATTRKRLTRIKDYLSRVLRPYLKGTQS